MFKDVVTYKLYDVTTYRCTHVRTSIAQLDKASDTQAVGHRFEQRQDH